MLAAAESPSQLEQAAQQRSAVVLEDALERTPTKQNPHRLSPAGSSSVSTGGKSATTTPATSMPADLPGSGGGLYGITRKLMQYVVPGSAQKDTALAKNGDDDPANDGQDELALEAGKGFPSMQESPRKLATNGTPLKSPVSGNASVHSPPPIYLEGGAYLPGTPSRSLSMEQLNPHLVPGSPSIHGSQAQLASQSSVPSLSAVSENSHAVEDAQVEQQLLGSTTFSMGKLQEALRPSSISASPELASYSDGLAEYDDGEVVVNLKAKVKGATIPDARPPPFVEPTVMPIGSSTPNTDGHNGAPPTQLIAEFDPLIPQDWMINFDSPRPSDPRAAAAMAAASAANTPRPMRSKAVSATPPPSLLDSSLTGQIATPTSIAKYSERDVMVMKKSIQDQAEKELSVIQSDFQLLEDKYQQSEASRQEMKTVVDEFEQTMGKMIEDAQQEKERHAIMMGKLTDEKMRATTELNAVETSFKDLRNRYEELKSIAEQYRRNETILKQTIESLQKDVLASEQRVEAVKTHAEKKLEEANTEVARLREANEQELALLRAKLQKSDLRIKALEQTIQQKEAENAELMGICDELIVKMEGKKK